MSVENPTKKAIKVCFSHQCDNAPQESLTFNNNKIQSAPDQKHLWLILDSTLDFHNQHIDDKINEIKSLGLWEDFQWHSLEKSY